MAIDGFCQPDFQGVQVEFERNFAERGEVGASVCIIREGEPVVDLWGGLANRTTGTPWQRDTIGLVWSCTKGAAALCAHVLVARGLLDLDAPVARYWPEFAQTGKGAITVRLVLSHQAGLPALRQPFRPGGLYDWQYMVDLLAAEEPFWPPGTRQGYHATTFGFLVGELVQRVSGKPIDQFFREEIAAPLALDFFLGLPDEHHHRVAPTLRPDVTPAGETPSLFLTRAGTEPTSLQALVWKNSGRAANPRDQDTPAAYRAVLPSQGGITNARGLAGLYAPLALGGEQRGVRLVDEGTLAQMGVVASATAVDAVLLIGLRLGLGFWKSSDNRHGPPGARDSLILSEEAFGHPGMGGSLGFADPKARIAFGYTMNKQGRGVALNERGQSLVDATYRALGYQTNRFGRWMGRGSRAFGRT
jgi:CubicO group peptidase (beta-lactamase class C family)